MAEIHTDGTMIIKIALVDKLIWYKDAQAIAKKFMELARSERLLSVETEVIIPNEFILLSEECSLGF